MIDARTSRDHEFTVTKSADHDLAVMIGAVVRCAVV